MSDTVFQNGTLIVPDWMNDVNNLRYGAGSSSRGSALLDFVPGYTGSVSRTAANKFREVVSIKDFGAVGDGLTDDTAALQAARDYIASQAYPPILKFSSGTYKYTTSPNWGITNAIIEAEGKVVLLYQGTGNAVNIDAGASALIWNMTFGSEENQFIVQGTTSTQHGVYVRSIHHSKIGVNVRGAGTAYAGLRIEFSVCTSYYYTCSGNEQNFGGAIPLYGMYLSNRGANEKTSACVFHNPIVEGIVNGVYLNSADKNLFLGGTSEGNTGIGVFINASCFYNTFYGIDLELNTIRDFDDTGTGTIWINILSDSTSRVAAGARNVNIIGGQFKSIVDNGSGTSLDKIEYASSVGGTISGSGTNRSKRSVYNINGGVYDHDITTGSIESITSCATGVATTVITLPSTGNNYYFVGAYLPNVGAAATYGAEAIIYQDGASAKIMHQANGTNLVVTLSGQNIQVNQTSGSTQNVTSFALKQ